MGLLDIFINQEGKEAPKKPVTKAEESFPQSESFPTQEKMPQTETGQVFSEPSTFDAFKAPPTQGNPFLQEVLDVYQKGFENLNLPGVDFLEFYKAVSADINNVGAYKMAMQILQGVDSGFTKEKALRDANHYLTNITKAYEDFKASGLKKKENLLFSKSSEAATLTQEIGSLEQQIAQLTTQLTTKKTQQSVIDHKYEGQMRELDSRLSANEEAKNTLLSRIQTVTSNINSI